MPTPISSKLVSIVRCDDYDSKDVEAAVRRAVELIGGLGKFVSPGDKVLLKPNMLSGAHPDKCATTHPEVLLAVGKLLKEHGCKLVIFDSPGGGTFHNERTLRRTYRGAKFDEVALKLGIELNYDTSYRDVPANEGKKIKRFSIVSPALDCDSIVVVSKAKTHALTLMTGAAKNIFGLIPGIAKPTFHSRLRRSDEFSEMIIDLNELLKPKLQIMDAIVGMEGEGPSGGTPRKMRAILASADYTAIDVAVSRIMGFEPIEVGTIKAAHDRGFIEKDMSDVHFVGDDIETFVLRDFKRPSTYSVRRNGPMSYGLASRFLSYIANAYAPRPRIVVEKCAGCGKCARGCPEKTISIKNRKARISYRRCIKCYCCHEMCDENAIILERSPSGKFVAWFAEMR